MRKQPSPAMWITVLPGFLLTPKQVLSAIARKCPQDSIVATDVGQHQMWAIQHLHF